MNRIQSKTTFHKSFQQWINPVLVFGALCAIGLLIVFKTAPLPLLLGDISSFTVGTAIHGALSTLLFILATVGIYQASQLIKDESVNVKLLQVNTTALSILSLLTIIYGNWIYIGYRANTPYSPRSYFLEVKHRHCGHSTRC